MAIKDDLRKYDKIQKIKLGERGGKATGCLQDYLYFKGNFKLIAIYLSEQKALYADTKAI